MLTVDPHPLLDAAAFTTVFPAPLAELPSPGWLLELLRLDAPVPLRADDAVRAAVRDLLRHGGFKPTGRSKPASEYLIKAVEEGRLASINLGVDVCNVVSLHSGLPISVVDRSKATAPFRLGIAPEGSSYVFNSSGQVIDLGGLLCLHDSEGPSANAVKDAQRTKTDEHTSSTLTIIWGCSRLTGRTRATLDWYRALLERAGATVQELPVGLQAPS